MENIFYSKRNHLRNVSHNILSPGEAGVSWKLPQALFQRSAKMGREKRQGRVKVQKKGLFLFKCFFLLLWFFFVIDILISKTLNKKTFLENIDNYTG